MDNSSTASKPNSISDNSVWGKGKLFFKALIIFCMALALWVPAHFITGLVNERADRQKEAFADISSKWAGKQLVTGPLLALPYMDSVRNDKGVSIPYKKYLYILPEQLQVKSNVLPEKRYRGIYEMAVYKSSISLTGRFQAHTVSSLRVPASSILWNEAALLFKVTDNQRGINSDFSLRWDNNNYPFNPQAAGFADFQDAFTAPIGLNADSILQIHQFSISLLLSGSEQLAFSTFARDNNLEMSSPWATPAFSGFKVPDARKVSANGFTANWKYMNRTVPEIWNDKIYPLEETSLGTNFLIAVNNYDKILRSVKYALLCIILTFTSFFLIETIYKKPLHLIQYGLAGLALVLFYTLLLSVSEYTSFNFSYGIATLATVLLVTWYIKNIMRSGKLAVFTGIVLSVVYTYIFFIVQLEDYALLMGSIGLFTALAVIMFFTRKLQWA